MYEINIIRISFQARAMGANAIVGVRFECNTIFEGSLDVVLYGTAVAFER